MPEKTDEPIIQGEVIPDPYQETAEALLADLASRPNERGLPPEGEYVDSFIDSRGVERKTPEGKEIVRLDAEACEAIESYYTEHDEFADRIEELIDWTAILQDEHVHFSARIEAGKKDRFLPLTRIADREEFDKEIDKILAGSEQAQVEIDPNDEFTVQITKKLAEIAEIRKVLEAPLPEEGASFDEIIEHFNRHAELFPDNPTVEKGSVFGRKKRKTETRSRIDSLRLSLENKLSALENEISKLIGEAIKTTLFKKLSSVQPFNKRYSFVYQPESHHEILEIPFSDISENNAVTQNMVSVAEFTPIVAEVCEQFDTMHDIEDSVLDILRRPDVASFLKAVDPERRQRLLDNIFKYEIGHTLSLDYKGVVDGFSSLISVAFNDMEGYYSHRRGLPQSVLGEAKSRARAALGQLYAEPALPKMYIQDPEKQRLGGLMDKFNKLKPDTELSLEAQLEKIESWEGVEIRRADEVLTHSSSFAGEIIRDGFLRTKRSQMEYTGKLHEQMKPGTISEGKLKTHSRVPHFAKDAAVGYILSNPDYIKGVIIVPLGRIAEVSPINDRGRQLKLLPLSANPDPIYTPRYAPTPGARQHVPADSDDITFYSSPVAAECDDYEIPIDEECAVVLFAPSDELKEDSPDRPHIEEVPGDALVHGSEEAAVRPGLRSGTDYISSPDRRYHGQIVIALRVAPMEFVPEIPNQSVTRFRNQYLSNVSIQRPEGEIQRNHSDPNDRRSVDAGYYGN